MRNLNHFNLSTLFHERSREHAARVALHYAEGDVTYAELAARAGAFTGLLLDLGLRQGSVVAIASTKRPDTFAMMLACLQMGIAYVGLDVQSPLERLEKICATCRPAAIFADHIAPVFAELAASLGAIFLDAEVAAPAGRVLPDCLRQAIDGSTMAYIMYTSGSTGVPKGVAITHQNVLHFIEWSTNHYGVGPQDNFANVSPLYFDNSVFDFYTALFSGASVTPISKTLLEQPKALVDHVTAMRCTIWFSVPSLLVFLLNMKVLTDKVLGSVRVFTFGGEGFPKTELRKLYSLYSRKARLVNVYGPTECTCICSSCDITEADFADMTSLAPLGRLNPNFSCVILDEERSASEGELCLLGPNVGAGYYNERERSAAVFTQCQHAPHFMKPMYRTGDLVRIEDGVLFFLGRKDNQIKHMGYRIELEEIEAALNSLANVSHAAVVYRREKIAYGKIWAFVVPENETAPIDGSAELKRLLAELLPPYMLPNVVVFLECLPKNANGKVDRKSLVVWNSAE